MTASHRLSLLRSTALTGSSAAAAANGMPAMPASPAGVRPAVSSHDLAGAASSAVPALLGAEVAMPAGRT